MPTRKILEAPELGIPRYKKCWFLMVSVIERFHRIINCSIFAFFMCVHNLFCITGLHLVENGTTDQKDSSAIYRMLPLPLTKTNCV